jgi:hypothetical protein
MSTAAQIGTIASKTDKLLVQRQGDQITLQQGDAILAGDVLQNRDMVSIDIELPAQSTGQANSLLTLAPESAAQIATSTTTNGSMIEVTSLTEGVELFAISEGTDGAVLLADAGTGFSGLVGAGLLSAGSAAGGLSGIATAIGGGVGVAALAASSGDDTNVEGSGFTDVRVDNGDQPTEPVNNPENPGENENPDQENPENPEEPGEPTTPVDEGTTGTPLDAIVDPLADALGSSPLSVISDPLFDALGSLPIGSAPNPADSLPLDAITGNLPT